MFKNKRKTDEEATATMLGIGESWVELMATIPQLVPSEVLPVYRSSGIVCGGKRYIFRKPLECVFHWDDECAACLWIECDAIDLFSTGYMVSEAISL